MRISVEISMYPLTDEYVSEILSFISEIKKETDVDIRTNGMSTQIFGEYEQIFGMLNRELKKVIEKNPSVVFVTKFLGRDVGDYK